MKEIKRRLLREGFPIGDANLEGVHENGLRQGPGNGGMDSNYMVLNDITLRRRFGESLASVYGGSRPQD
jgi:hypothetical protein